MTHKRPNPQPAHPTSREEHGSALVMAIFVLVLLSGMGMALLFLSQSEVRMSQADVRTKMAFYLAEAGLEDARASLFALNGNEDFSDDLKWFGGLDQDIQFVPDNLTATYDSSGNLTGFTGFADDRPLAPLSTIGEGWYAAFLTNDPAELINNTTDGNRRVMITAVGAGSERSLEMVQAIIERRDIFPTAPPSTITLLGPAPVFSSGNSKVKRYIGEDCDGAGIPDLHVPVVGTIGSSAEADAEAGMETNPTFDSGGGYVGQETVADITDDSYSLVSDGMGAIDPAWTDCQNLQDIVDDVRDVADVVCVEGSSPYCTIPPASPGRVVFSDGDFTVGPNDSGEGLLFVTGKLRFHGKASWKGMIFVIGKGDFVHNGGGNGTISGATIVADIAGPDNVYGTDDDCTGGDNGFNPISYDDNGGGNSDTVFCLADINAATPAQPYKIVSFQQR